MADNIKVLLIETFQGQKFILRLNKEYKKSLFNVLDNLFATNIEGSLAHLSIRFLNEDKYEQIPTIVSVSKGNINEKEDINK